MGSNDIFPTVIKLLELGYSMIPSGGGEKGKSPLYPWTEYQKRLPTRRELDNWQFRDHPTLWGWVTGQASGMVVLGSDSPKMTERLEALGIKPHIITPAGAHFLFRSPGHNIVTRAEILPKLDVRADGGFANCLGTRPDGGTYTIAIWPTRDTLYDWDILRKDPELWEVVNEGSAKTRPTATGHEPRKRIFKGEGRNQALTREAGRLIRIYKEPAIVKPMIWAYNQAVCVPPLTEDENARTWEKSLEKWAAKANVQETQDKPQEEIQPYNREQYLKVLSQWLYIKDYQAIDIVMATALTILLPGDPVWLLLIAPPGSTKTEYLRSFTNDRVYSLSTLTPQTLISGLKGNKTADLISELDGKILILKDFTSILSKKNEDQTAIFADLREAYDGYLEKSYGSGTGTKRYKSRFGVIAGVTDVIDMYRKVHSLLGERFLKCRIRTNAEDAINKAGEMAGKEEEMRRVLSEATNGCFAYYASRIKDSEPTVVEKDTYQQIKALANITAKLRSEVARDNYHNVLYHPQAEVGTRLTKQFLKLAQGICLFYEHDIVGQEEYKVVLRVAQDSIPRQRLKLVLSILGCEPMTTQQIGDKATIPTTTTKELLEDLWMLDLIERTGENPYYWHLGEGTSNLLIEANFDSKGS